MLTDGTVKYSCSCLLPQGLNPNPQLNTCLQSLQLPLGVRCPNWMRPCRTCCSLPQLDLPVNSQGGGPRSLTWRVSDWSTSVGCWDCLHVLYPDRLSTTRCVAVLFVCSLSVALAVFVSWTRGVHQNWRRNDAAAVCDDGAMFPDWMDRDDDGTEEISR